MLSALVAGHRGRACRAAGGNAQMCSSMARASPKSGRNGQTHLQGIAVVHIWYLVTKTAAVRAPRPDREFGTHNIWHNICVCAELVGEIGCKLFWLGSTTMPHLHPPPQHERVSMH
eukprot:2889723-Prymnesium_polylepis.2